MPSALIIIDHWNPARTAQTHRKIKMGNEIGDGWVLRKK